MSTTKQRSYAANLDYDDEGDSSAKSVLLTLENNKRYAHTASSSYQITQASIQPDDRRLPHCICNTINDEKRPKSDNDNRVIVIVEHDLKEFILCILDTEKDRQCKLNLVISSGEQIAFRTIGRYPVQLAGMMRRAAV